MVGLILIKVMIKKNVLHKEKNLIHNWFNNENTVFQVIQLTLCITLAGLIHLPTLCGRVRDDVTVTQSFTALKSSSGGNGKV